MILLPSPSPPPHYHPPPPPLILFYDGPRIFGLSHLFLCFWSTRNFDSDYGFLIHIVLDYDDLSPDPHYPSHSTISYHTSAFMKIFAVTLHILKTTFFSCMHDLP